MKKYMLFALCALMITCGAAAQSASPRWGLPPSSGNTGNNLTYFYGSPSVTLTKDTIFVYPSAYSNDFYLTLPADSAYFVRITTLAGSYKGDRMTLIASGGSGSSIILDPAFPVDIKAGSTATLSTKGRAILTYVFDGAYWVECSRIVM
jgi:hypothetical protein